MLDLHRAAIQNFEHSSELMFVNTHLLRMLAGRDQKLATLRFHRNSSLRLARFLLAVWSFGVTNGLRSLFGSRLTSSSGSFGRVGRAIGSTIVKSTAW
jgi:hypothetical protein